MRIHAMFVALLLAGCAPPGYHYEAGDFFTLTPNDPSPSPQPVVAQQPTTTMNSMCGNATGSDCAIIAGRNAERYQECMEYKSYAFNAFLAYQRGMSQLFTEQMVMQYAHVQTQDGQALVEGLVKAAYSKKWALAQTFANDAFNGCMNSHFLGI